MEWTWYLKKFLTWGLYPLSISLFLQAFGFIQHLRGRRSGVRWIFAGFLIFVLTSIGIGFPRALYHLERIYPSFSELEAMTKHYPQLPSARWIVVLGAGSFEYPEGSPVCKLPPLAVSRVVEAIWLHHRLPHTKILFCGGSVFNQSIEAEVMAGLAKELGVDKKDLDLETKSQDTADQAKAVALRLGKGPILLVTSAWHLPRAVYLFKAQGIDVIPVPANFDTHYPPARFQIPLPFPSSESVGASETITKQALGSVWERIRSNPAHESR